jgi:hypothetical protein
MSCKPVVDHASISEPELSDWQCHTFGSNGDGITWRPLKGKVPNCFWRKMQYLAFGNKWIRDKKREQAAQADKPISE